MRLQSASADGALPDPAEATPVCPFLGIMPARRANLARLVQDGAAAVEDVEDLDALIAEVEAAEDDSGGGAASAAAEAVAELNDAEMEALMAAE